VTFGSAVPGDTNPDPEKELRKRGIAEWVWKARPYVRYTKDHCSAVREAHQLLGKQLPWLMGIVNQSAGWMCVRHAPPGVALVNDEGILPQLRPDEEVRTGPPTIHHHPTERPTGPVVNPYPSKNQGKLLPRQWISTAKAKWKHINPKRQTEKPFDLATGLGRHNGVNCEQPHWHASVGKYIFPPGENRAKRIDVHPLALPLFGNASRVFFSLEGQWKADSILSRNEAVFSVPSVTLWDCVELSGFAATYLRDKLVVLAIDADGHENPLVMSQALYCQTYLKSLGLGLRVCVAAPPLEGLKDKIKGWDDFLGVGWEQGGLVNNVDDVHVHERVAPDLSSFIAEQRASGVESLRALRNANMLEFLALHASHDGELPRTLKTIARMMAVDGRDGADPRTARKTLLELERLRTIDIEGSIEAGENRRLSKDYTDPTFGWVDPPVITIRPEYRATQLEPVRLGDWCAGERGEAKPPSLHTVERRDASIELAAWVGARKHVIGERHGLRNRQLERILKPQQKLWKQLQTAWVVYRRSQNVPFSVIARDLGMSENTARSRYEPWDALALTLFVVAMHKEPKLRILLNQVTNGASAKSDFLVPIEEIEMTLAEFLDFVGHDPRLEAKVDEVLRELREQREEMRERFPTPAERAVDEFIDDALSDAD
jgi:hypothetical protein